MGWVVAFAFIILVLLGALNSAFGTAGTIVGIGLIAGCFIWIVQAFNKAGEKKAAEDKQREAVKFKMEQFRNHLRILDDSVNILHSTTNLDTFYSRCDLVFEKLDTLDKLLPSLPDFSMDDVVNDLHSSIPSAVEKEKVRLLRSSNQELFEGVRALKTEKAKQNRLTKYLTNLQEHHSFFDGCPEYENILNEVSMQLNPSASQNISAYENQGSNSDAFSDEFYDEDAEKEADAEFEKIRPELEQAAMQRSAEFATRHEKQVGTINLEALEKVYHQNPLFLSNAELLFLDYMDGYRYGNNIGGYWTHDFNIQYQTVLEKYFSYGYMKFADARTTLSKYTIPEPKKFLELHGQPTTGKKQDLINRILDKFDEATIFSAFPRKVFVVTDAGHDAISKKDYIFYFQENMTVFCIPLEIAEKYHFENPQLNKYELALSMLSERASRNLSKRDYGLYRNDLYAASVVCNNSGDYTRQLELLVQICTIDYYGYGNNGIQDKSDASFATAILWNIAHNSVYIALGGEEEDFFMQSIHNLPSCFKQNDSHRCYYRIVEEVKSIQD